MSDINWTKEQRLDPNLGVIIRLIESGQLNKRKLQGKDSSEVKSFLRNKKSLKLVKDVLYRKSFSDNSTSKKTLWQLVVPKIFRERALLGCHDDVGHQGNIENSQSVEGKVLLAWYARRGYTACLEMF